jgi:hypothetical protein
VNPLAGQDEHETLESLFRNVDLISAENHGNPGKAISPTCSIHNKGTR